MSRNWIAIFENRYDKESKDYKPVVKALIETEIISPEMQVQLLKAFSCSCLSCLYTDEYCNEGEAPYLLWGIKDNWGFRDCRGWEVPEKTYEMLNKKELHALGVPYDLPKVAYRW